MARAKVHRSWSLIWAAGAAAGLGLAAVPCALGTPKPPAAAGGAAAEAKPVLTESVTKAIETYDAGVKKAQDEKAKLGEVLPKLADEALSGLDVSKLTADDVQALMKSGMLRFATALDGVRARIGELALNPGLSGVKSALLGLSLLDRGEGKEAANAAMIGTALNHPGLAGALKENTVPEFYSAVSAIPPTALKGAAPSLLKLAGDLPSELPTDVAPRVVGIMTVLLDDKAETTPEQREPMRRKFVSIVENAEKAAAADSATDEKAERTRKSLARAKAFLTGAYAKGTLVNNPAPELDLTWWSAEPKISSLSELKGKVVVLDFWATWCGPCVASFPKVKELAAYYEGFPVEIVGITSLQGYHIGEDRTKIDCKDDPAKEMGLMPEYIKQKQMTWKIGFTKQDVFNPEYGVRGIPHVAIIDSKGVVRFRGLHPMDPMEHKIEMIDGLLKEAGLPVPTKKDSAG